MERVAIAVKVMVVLLCWTPATRSQNDPAMPLSPLVYSTPASCPRDSDIFLSGMLSCAACGGNSQPSPDGAWLPKLCCLSAPMHY